MGPLHKLKVYPRGAGEPVPQVADLRSIPACAGEPYSQSGPIPACAGEYVPFQPNTITGLSPRVRGNPLAN